MRGTVVSLFDYTGEALRPWAVKGYRCVALDLQHKPGHAVVDFFASGGRIEYHHWDSDTVVAGLDVARIVGADDVVFLFGFPPCTDLAGSGARHWASKLADNPNCQNVAVGRAKLCATIADHLACPYAIENPQGALSRLWRKQDHSFNPCDFGGYLAVEDAEHPIWPDYIAPRDAYKKRTLLWAGNGFVMPPKDYVAPEVVKVGDKQGSRQWAKLGGKSMKTKNIRSATPRGFAIAVCLANMPTAEPSVAPGFDVARALGRFGLSLS